jgi:phosphocarrier protein FPr
MKQEGAIDALVRTRSADEIIAALTGTAAPTLAATAPAAAPECEVTWQLDYPNGLHARPATRWVDVAKRHASEVCVIKGGEIADAKSLTALLGLGVVAGDTLRLGASGADARRAVEALLTAVQSLSADEKADAERARLAAEAVRKQGALWQASAEGKRLRGIPASPGLAIGRIVRHVTQALVAADTPGQAIDDGAALEQALEAVKAELVADVGMLRSAIGEIMRGHGAAWAWQKVLHAQVERQRSLADPLLAARALDLRDAGERVLARLLGVARQSLTLTEPSIVVAEDLTPSDTLQLDMRHVVGLAISSGGPTSSGWTGRCRRWMAWRRPGASGHCRAAKTSRSSR